MTTQSFENLDFSFLIEGTTAYLQEWDDGAWSEPEQHTLPLDTGSLPKRSRLARAVKSFKTTPEVRESLERGLVREPAPAKLPLVWRLFPILRTDP
jgi:hypothetical protein